MLKIVAIGDAMVELSRPPGAAPLWRLGAGGDVLNTSTYLARLGADVSLMTVLGTTSPSRIVSDHLADNGIDPSLVLVRNGAQPSLYMIETDHDGERSFHYWAERPAAGFLFECEGIETALDQARKADLILLSGITLSLFNARDRERLIGLCVDVRQRGGLVAFDPNYRPRRWLRAEDAAREFERIAPHISIALPSLEDERLLCGPVEAPDCADRWIKWGAQEVALKLGRKGALLAFGETRTTVSTTVDPGPLDTTGAGDAFNAGYLSARLAGNSPETAAKSGHCLAGVAIRHPGAIIPAEHMPRGVAP